MRSILLDNGITVYLDPVKEARTIGIGIMVNIGSIYEPEKKRGISHLLEHMLFKSNRKYTAEKIATGIEMSGGEINAETSTFFTMYAVECIPSGFEKVVDILFSMFENDSYKNDEFESEKSVVLTEIERYRNDPESMLWDLSAKAVYGNSDYGDPVSGFRETVSSITKEELEDFKAKFYTPDNITIILSGKFSKKYVETLKKKFRVLYGDGKKKKKPKKGKKNNIIEKMKTENQIYFSLNFSVNEDIHKIIAFQNFVTPGLSSLLFQILREKYGIGYRLFFGLNRFYPGKEAIVSLMVPGFEKSKEGVLKDAINELFEILRKKDLQKYYSGRKKLLRFMFQKTRINIFERVMDSYKSIIYGESYDVFMKKVLETPLQEIIEFASRLKNGSVSKILPE